MVTLKSLEADRLAVTFRFPASIWTESVSVVGDFNGWDSSAHPLNYSRADDEWQITIPLEPGRSYRYSFLLDGGELCTDRPGIIQVPQAVPTP